MKKIYKLGCLVVFSFIGLNTYAQLPVSFGVNAGVNLSNAHVEDHIGDIKARVGFQVGVTAEYALTDAFYLQSGLSFTTKGFKNEYGVAESSISYNVKHTVNEMYLQLPVKAAYKFPVMDNMNIVFNLGPYFAYGVGGKTKTEINNRVGTIEGTIKDDKYNTFSDEGLKRFDFGLGAGVGAEFGQIVVGLNYELGLINIAREDGNVKNRNASLTLGYRF